MDTELLKTFLEVEKTRNFARAAEVLFVTNAAISARIRQLEAAIGGPLFTRHRNNLSLTASGERLKPYAEQIVASLNQALHEASVVAGEVQQLAIGGTPNLWDSILQDYLHHVHDAYPDTTLRAECLGTDLLKSQLVARVLDLVVLFDPPKLPAGEVELVQNLELVLVSTDPEIAADPQLLQHFVQIDWGSGFDSGHPRPWPERGKPVLHTSTGRIALDFMLQNGGTAFLPVNLVEAYISIGRLHRLVGVQPVSRNIYAAYLNDNGKLSMLREIVQLLRANPFQAAPTLQP